jgi:uncharacterized protein YndB with AHSA1/START domain
VYGHAPFRFVSTVDLTITPEQLFELLDDAESWPQWATVITKVTWTSRNRTASAPPGPSTCAAASSATWGALPLASWVYLTHLRGEFLAWEPHSHMAFRFNQAANRSIAAFANKRYASARHSAETIPAGPYSGIVKWSMQRFGGTQ